MKRNLIPLLMLVLLCFTATKSRAQNQMTYGFMKDPADPVKLTALAYPNFTSTNVTISTALFTFYLPAGTITNPSIPPLPGNGTFNNINGSWRIEKITPALYASFGFNAADLQGNDVYQCILQNSPSPNATSGTPISLFSFRLPGDCMGGDVKVHINDNAIQMALLNNLGININNQMSVSINDAPSTDIYSGNNPVSSDYPCPLDGVPTANPDLATVNEDNPITINVTANDNFGSNGPSTSPIVITTPPLHGVAVVNNNGTPNNPADDKITYTPNPNYNGPDVLIYKICDLDNDCDTALVSINVLPVNDPPNAVNDTVSTPEDTPILISALVNDTDIDGMIVPTTLDLDPFTPGVQTSYTGAGGMFVRDNAGVITFTPASNFNGLVTVLYQVCDNGTPLPSQCDTARIFVTVTPVNDPPTVPNETVSTPEDTPTNVCAPITDPDNTSFTVTSICAPHGGVISNLTNPASTQYCLTYTPNLNFNGPDTLCIRVCDGSGACDTSYVYINVTPVNDPPVVNNDNATTNEDTPVTFNILANDSDVDGMIDPTTVDLNPGLAGIQTTFTIAGQGTFTYGGVGNVTFTPVANFNGTVTAQYQVCDNGTPLPAQCGTATITVTVNAVNDPPVANNDNATTNEDTPVTFNILANDTDVDGMIDPNTVDLNPGLGGIQTTFTVAGQGTFNYTGAGNVTFTPVSNFNGTVTAQYQVCDNGTPLPAQCATATITVTVTPVNDPPVVVNDNATTNEDTPVTFNILANDSDVDGMIDPTTVDLNPGLAGIQTTFTVAGQGTFTYGGMGNVTFTPVANFNGTVTAQYQVCDNGTPLPAQCGTATITVTVNAVNDPPVANNDNATTNEDTPVTFNILANDTDVDGMIDPTTVDLNPGLGGIQTTFTVAGQGTFNYTGAGNVTFTPVANFNGTVTAQYQVCDNGTPLPAQCATATITVIVTPVNDPPVVVNDNATTNEDTPVTFNILANDSDVDGMIDPTTVDLNPGLGGIQTTFTVAGQGTFNYTGSGNVTFTPVANFNGTVTAQYQVCDNGTPLPALCGTATITVTVNAVNDPPVVNNDNVTTNEDTPITFNILANDTDVDGMIDPATVDLNPGLGGIQTTLTVAGQGTFTYTGSGNVTFTPVANFNGTVTAQYQVCDNGTPLPPQCGTATITVIVNAVNDPPVANNDNASTLEDTPVTFNILANDTDIDGMIDPTSVDLNLGLGGIQTTFTVAGQGTFNYTGSGNVTFTPVSNFNGTVTAQYLVCDNGTPLPALCATATITVVVTPVNDPPIANNDNVTTPEDTPITFNVTSNDTDVDGMIDNSTLDLDPNTPGVQTTFTVTGQGIFVRDGFGNVTFTPVLNFNGTVTTPYKVCDNGTPLPPQCATAVITVIVTSVNDAPVANNDNATLPEDTQVSVPVLNNDSDVDGILNPASVTIIDPPNHGTATVNPANGVITYIPTLEFVGNDTLLYAVCDNGTPILCDTAAVYFSVTATSVRLLAKIRLQGAVFGSPDTLMRDNLRILGRVPKHEPYTALGSPFINVNGGGNEIIVDTTTVFANHGKNSIVDWVFVELRNPNVPGQVVATRCALLQRDGDVVDIDGVSPLEFENTLPAFYYVAIRHRNHLGTMTANAIIMTNSGTTIDFTNLNTPLWDDGTGLDGYEQATVGGKYAMWAGNVNVNTSVVFAGQNNDKDPIFNQVDQAPGNFLHSQSYVFNGYLLGDVNLDGHAIFAGQGNDVDFIFNNVDGHPRNLTRSQSYVIRQQLP